VSVVLVVTAMPIPEHQAHVIAAFEDAAAKVHKEPGVVRWALLKGHDRLVVIEKYESERARADHARGAALAELLTALRGKLATDLDVQVLAERPTGDLIKGQI
jgi:quinol monooxygenase YgiN